MGVAISAAFILPDLPHNTRGFTKEELDLAQLRMIEDVGEADVDAEGQGPFDGLKMALKDVKIYIMSLTFTAYVVGLSFNAFFVRFPPWPSSIIMLTFAIAVSYRDPWLQLCPHASHELAPLVVLLHRFSDRCLELRSSSRKGWFAPGIAIRPDSLATCIRRLIVY